MNTFYQIKNIDNQLLRSGSVRSTDYNGVVEKVIKTHNLKKVCNPPPLDHIQHFQMDGKRILLFFQVVIPPIG